MKENQLSLFHAPAALPDGFSYQADVLSAEDEHELVDQIKGLAFREFELRGFLAKPFVPDELARVVRTALDHSNGK